MTGRRALATARYQLQWGHGTDAVEKRIDFSWILVSDRRRCFNAATARMPWRTVRLGHLLYGPGWFELQCGHGTNAVENVTAKDFHADKKPRHCRSASMRPRHECRGERGQHVEHHCRPERRPAPRHCFNAATARRPWITLCSPRRDRRRRSCFNGATARRPWRTTRNAGPASAIRVLLRSGFNAATARRPWRTARRYLARPSPFGQLQCGHGTNAVENSAAMVMPLMAVRRASMRPRHEGRGEHSLRVAVNGEAENPGLQWGHGTNAVENSPVSFSGTLATAGRNELQCGHGTKAVENETRTPT